MADKTGPESKPKYRRHEERVRSRVIHQEERKSEGRASKGREVWFGLGMFGLVGWSVAIPSVAGIAVGVWLDMTYPGRISWTLTCLVAGVALGCLNAWYWVKRESEKK